MGAGRGSGDALGDIWISISRGRGRSWHVRGSWQWLDGGTRRGRWYLLAMPPPMRRGARHAICARGGGDWTGRVAGDWGMCGCRLSVDGPPVAGTLLGVPIGQLWLRVGIGAMATAILHAATGARGPSPSVGEVRGRVRFFGRGGRWQTSSGEVVVGFALCTESHPDAVPIGHGLQERKNEKRRKAPKTTAQESCRCRRMCDSAPGRQGGRELEGGRRRTKYVQTRTAGSIARCREETAMYMQEKGEEGWGRSSWGWISTSSDNASFLEEAGKASRLVSSPARLPDTADTQTRCCQYVPAAAAAPRPPQPP